MRHRVLVAATEITLAFSLLAPAGCGSRGSNLPAALTVMLPDGTEERVTMGSGVATLADTEWDLYAVAENAQVAPFVRVRFNANGSLHSFDNNTIAREVFGSQILFDGQRHRTNQFGLDYAAATYGAETLDASGFAFTAKLTAYAAGLVEAAQVTAKASGNFDAEDPCIIRGTFNYSIRVKISSIPTPPAVEPFSFIGYLAKEEDGQDPPS